jgi:hypothetical protein
MKTIRTTLSVLAALAAIGFTVAHAAPTDPLIGTFSDEALQNALDEVSAAAPPEPGWEDVAKVQEEAEQIAAGERLLNGDDDTCHYARGMTVIVHVFVSHNGGTWTATERGDAAAKASVAKDYFIDTAPAGANVHFDFEGSNSYWYYHVDYNGNIPDSGMSSDLMETVIGLIGFSDTDGDSWRVDDMTLHLQNTGGGYDNVILCFEPKQTGRAWASYSFARCALYTDSNANVFAHEWGHLFGACDEYVEGGECNGGINCGACQSGYLDDTINNGNCQLVSCPSDVQCTMINNTFNNICWYTQNHWGWYDEDADGYLDWTKRRVSGNTFANIYLIPHNGYADWNNVTDGYAIAQQWNTWSVAGLRPPAGTDYDLQLYGENNHNYLLASSTYSGSAIDFVVSDYNHDYRQNEHLMVNLYNGPQTNYKLHWESGTGLLYPDGVVRTGSFQSYQVVRVWDVPLFAGETVNFNLDVTAGTLDVGMALFRSYGEGYHAGRVSAQWQRDTGGAGADENYAYTAPEDDVYGFVIWTNNAVAGDFSIQIGPAPYTLSEEVPFNSGLDLRLYNYAANANYWSFIGSRPEAGANVTTRLFDDSAFQNELETSNNYAGVEFIAADYNAVTSTDHVRVVNPPSTGNHRTEWEHDADILTGVASESWGSGHVGKVWDVNLVAGRSYFLREYHSTLSTLDTGVYVFGSNDGDRFKARADYAAGSNFRAPNEGGEWFSYTAPANDWYGIYNIVNDESSGSYSLWFGAKLALAEGVSERPTEEVTFASANVTTRYWTVFPLRPYFADQASIWLYADDAYTSTSFKAGISNGTGVPFVVGDFNHNALGVYYPRYRRTSGGAQGYDVEWEGGTEGFVYTGQVINHDQAWPTHHVADAYDLYVDGPRTLRIDLTDLGNDIDLGVAVFGSNGAEYWATPSDAMAMADVNPTGGPESVTVNFVNDDWYGIVVFSKDDVDGGGNYRMKIYDPATASVDDPRSLQFGLASTSKNPFADEAHLRFTLPSAGFTDLAIYDVSGRRVRGLVEDRVAAGEHTAVWDGRDRNGNAAPSGIYFARLRCGKDEQRIKIARSQ